MLFLLKPSPIPRYLASNALPVCRWVCLGCTNNLLCSTSRANCKCVLISREFREVQEAG